jgi:predicted TIM-barrel fold metal-dependent hydrolase
MLIDFHSHYYEANWFSALPQGQNVFTRAWPLLSNIDAQLAAMDVAGIDAKVLSAPAALLLSPGESVPIALMQRINDRMADLVAAYPGRLLAVATIDAFGGDAAAREVERAVRELGIRGIVVDCALGDRYLDAPEARPVLEAAAALGVAVFVHPVYPPWLTGRLARLGHTGILLARGTETAASLLALLRSGVLDELPNLNIVLPMIGAAFFLFAGMADLEHEEGWRGTTRPSMARQRLYVDTMGFDPAAIRFAVELLGAEHVLLGSDWPIMPIMPRQRVEETLAPLELTVDQRDAILGGNTLRLLTVTFH